MSHTAEPPSDLSCLNAFGDSWYMGLDALQGNGITQRLLYFFRDKALTPADEPLRKVRKSRILLFVGVQLAGFGATFAVTQTIGRFDRPHPSHAGLTR